MAAKISINLASMQKKEDELLKKEMNRVYSGASNEDCECHQTPLGSDFVDTHDANLYQSCDCASIWVIFGLTYGAQQ